MLEDNKVLVETEEQGVFNSKVVRISWQGVFEIVVDRYQMYVEKGVILTSETSVDMFKKAIELADQRKREISAINQ